LVCGEWCLNLVENLLHIVNTVCNVRCVSYLSVVCLSLHMVSFAGDLCPGVRWVAVSVMMQVELS
jgi:hypothetical protein